MVGRGGEGEGVRGNGPVGGRLGVGGPSVARSVGAPGRVPGGLGPQRVGEGGGPEGGCPEG